MKGEHFDLYMLTLSIVELVYQNSHCFTGSDSYEFTAILWRVMEQC